jgi:hypothetical protein
MGYCGHRVSKGYSRGPLTISDTSKGSWTVRYSAVGLSAVMIIWNTIQNVLKADIVQYKEPVILCIR